MGAARDCPATAPLRHPGPASPGRGRSQHADDLAVTPDMADGGLAARGPATTRPVSTRCGGPSTARPAWLGRRRPPEWLARHQPAIDRDEYELAADFAGQFGLRRLDQRSQAFASNCRQHWSDQYVTDLPPAASTPRLVQAVNVAATAQANGGFCTSPSAQRP